MSWYSVRIIYRSIIEGIEHPDQLMEESIRVFTASTDEEAKSKRQSVAGTGEHSYQNENGKKVRWVVDRIEEACSLGEDDLSDGVEVYSRLFRLYSPDSND